MCLWPMRFNIMRRGVGWSSYAHTRLERFSAAELQETAHLNFAISCVNKSQTKRLEGRDEELWIYLY